MDVTKHGFGIVMRADGTVPFDPPQYDASGAHVGGVHPDHRAAIIGHLVESGHHVHVNPETKVVTLHSGPMIDARDAKAHGAKPK